MLIETIAGDGSSEVLLLDRAVGAEDDANRCDDAWPDARLLDGTPTAAIRWSASSRTLRLYRDLMGQRGLVYARVGGGVIVASGEDVLRAHPDVSNELDQSFVAAFLALLPAARDETALRDIRCLGAGDVIEFGPEGECRINRTDLEPDYSWRGLPDDAIVERFREIFDHSVRTTCLGARRVGISLSAGLDSGSIAAAASRLPHRVTGGVLSVTHALEDFPEIDESHLVAALARDLGFENRPFRVDHLYPFMDADLRPACPDSPSQWLYREWYESGYQKLSDAGVDVWLSGGFGDHLFAGSVEWVVDALRFRRLGMLSRQLIGEIGRKGWQGVLRDTAVRRPVSRLLGRVSSHPDRLEWLQPKWRQRLRDRLESDLARYRAFPRPSQCTTALSASAVLDASSEHWHANRHAMEYRLPMRDLALTRFCLSLPADFSYRDGQSKWILREAMRGLLPETIRQRPKSSSLTPVFERAIQRSAESLRLMKGAAGDLPEQYLRSAAELSLDPDSGVFVGWQTANLGAWLERQSGRTADS